MVGVPLQFEKQVVCESMRGVPAVKNGDLFVLPVLQFFPHESIMFEIVDSFQIKDRSCCDY